MHASKRLYEILSFNNGCLQADFQNLQLLLKYCDFLVEISVTTGFIINGTKYISQLNKQCLLPLLPNMEYTYTAFMRQITFYLNSDALAHIMELILPIAFDDNIFESL